MENVRKPVRLVTHIGRMVLITALHNWCKSVLSVEDRRRTKSVHKTGSHSTKTTSIGDLLYSQSENIPKILLYDVRKR
jgi:hypothetical protein